jgi:hypothetical protein
MTARFNEVFVAWGSEIVKVGSSEEIPFFRTIGRTQGLNRPV